MICAGCRNEVLGGWAAGDERVFCAPCLREALAIAEGHELNRRLAALLTADRPAETASDRAAWLLGEVGVDPIPQSLTGKIHALAHNGYPEGACPICDEDDRLLRGVA